MLYEFYLDVVVVGLVQLRVDVVLAVDGLHRGGVEVGRRQGLQATSLSTNIVVYIQVG